MKALIINISLLLLLVACNNDKQEEHVQETAETIENEVSLSSEQYTTAGIETGKITTRRIADPVVANGRLDVPPQQMVSVSVPIAGFVKTTSMLQGTYVKRGQVIAILENLDYVQIQQDYLDIKSQYEYATAEYERQQELAKENVNAKKTLQQAKASYHSLQAKYKGFAGKLRLMHIDPEQIQEGNINGTINVYAPISGYITEVNVNVGQYVAPQDVLFRIVNTEHLHVELTVFEKDIPKLKIEQPVRFTLANEHKERTASVHLIGREIGKDRTIRVHCHLDSEDRSLLPGMFLKAVIETEGAEVNALPESAVLKYNGSDYIFVEKTRGQQDSTYLFDMVAITTGATDKGYTEVTLPDNINTQANIVIKGGYSLLSKLKNKE